MSCRPSPRARLRPLTLRGRAGALALAIAALAACGGDDDDSDEAAAVAGGAISTATTSLGDVLTGPSGLTLYAFAEDVDGVSTCFDSCATAWPPVDGTAETDGLSAAFDAVARPDGSTQLRVDGRWPLYTFAGDAAPGDVNGQGSAGVWFAVAPDGKPIGLGGTLEPAPAADAGDEAADTELGPVLTGADGLTLYAFTNDTPGVSNCLDPCSQTWPPVEEGTALAPAPDGERVTVIDRADGLRQVAVDGHPLYTFKDDLAPGDVNGQGVGGVWFAVSAEGEVLVPPTVRVGSTDAGDVLIDPEGFTLYTFASDERGQSNCADPCSTTWPPVPGDTEVGGNLDPAQFGQITRSDGQSQLTFKGWPLYRYVDDENPGDANGVLVGTPGTWTPVTADRVRLADDGDPQPAAEPPAPADEPAPEETAPETTVPAEPEPEPAPEPEPDPYAEPAPDAAPGVIVGETSLGHVLVDPDGLTLYAFTNDTASSSACNDQCAVAWPPAPGTLTLDPAVTAASSVIERGDGTAQLVVGDWPVYTFSGDAAPGDVNGQGSGGVWFAIAPDGTLIQ